MRTFQKISAFDAERTRISSSVGRRDRLQAAHHVDQRREEADQRGDDDLGREAVAEDQHQDRRHGDDRDGVDEDGDRIEGASRPSRLCTNQMASSDGDEVAGGEAEQRLDEGRPEIVPAACRHCRGCAWPRRRARRHVGRAPRSPRRRAARAATRPTAATTAGSFERDACRSSRQRLPRRRGVRGRCGRRSAISTPPAARAGGR